jgi:hypothetical protein
MKTPRDEDAHSGPPGRKLDPKPGLFTPSSTVPAHQVILARAATGDKSVLPAVRKLLDDEAYTASYGKIGGVAEKYLIRAAAGDNLLIAEAVERRAAAMRKEMLADCGPAPSFAERMAAARASNNWLAVHILECRLAEYDDASRAAAMLDRRLSQAERRLHAALKSLAVLRRLRGPAVTEVNVATTGNVLVDNRGAGAGAGVPVSAEPRRIAAGS